MAADRTDRSRRISRRRWCLGRCSWRAGRDLALADGDQASGIVAEFPLAAAGLTSAGVIPPLPIDL
jgi:hypothetical protein